ncbi:MADS-box transcription factor PHERES 2-like [Vicia villosa]|uniref:MADS-box transcription factor PHERES 2-like n=1 Tax=Vicia villosa TaxID=3911 RepID=UPI00273CEBDD|nr:MADS-box transcription factor PHERES 2-like [Vicia villosa]
MLKQLREESPFDSQPEVWPNLEGATNVIDRYKNSAVIKENRNVNQKSFIMQRITKVRDQVRKLMYDNREQELNLLMFDYLQNNIISKDLIAEELKDFDKVIEKKLKEVDNNIKKLDA